MLARVDNGTCKITGTDHTSPSWHIPLQQFFLSVTISALSTDSGSMRSLLMLEHAVRKTRTDTAECRS